MSSNKMLCQYLTKLSHGSWCKPRTWIEAAEFNLLVKKELAEINWGPALEEWTAHEDGHSSFSILPEKLVERRSYRITRKGEQFLEKYREEENVSY